MRTLTITAIHTVGKFDTEYDVTGEELAAALFDSEGVNVLVRHYYRAPAERPLLTVADVVSLAGYRTVDDEGVLDSIQREDGSGRCFNLKLHGMNSTVFVRTKK
jgi:hypothetical protein